YSGPTNIDSGTVAVGNNNSLAGGSALTFTGGTLRASAPVTLANPLTLNSSVASFAGTNPIYFTRTVTLTGPSAANLVANNLLTVGNTGGVTFAGQVVNGGQAGTLNLLGGTLYLTDGLGAASNYTGQTTVVSGVIVAEQVNSLGAASAV